MRTFFRWLGILIVVMMVIVAGLFAFDWSWVKGYVADQAGDVLGRAVKIGDLEVDLALEPIIRASRIRIENASWGSQPNLLDLSQLMFHIDLLELLKGRIVLPEIELIQPVAHLDQSKQGQLNWATLGAASQQGSTEQSGRSIALPTVERLRLHDGRLVYRDAGDEQFTVTLPELTATTTGDDQHLEVSASGQVADRSFQLALRTGSLAALETNASVPIHAELTLGDMQGRLDGAIEQPLQPAGIDLDVTVDGAPPDALFRILNAPISSPYPLHLQGRLRQNGASWAMQDLKMTLGKSDVAGDVTVDLSGKRPFVTAELSSETLELPALVKAISGAAPSRSDVEGNGARPQASFDPDQLRKVGGKLNFQADTLVVSKQTFQNVDIEGRLKDGHLAIKPKAEYVGGMVQADLEVKGGETPVQSAIHANFDSIDLKEALAKIGLPKEAAGAVNGRVDLIGSGHTLAALLDTVDGQVVLTMNGGRLDQLLVELAGLDIGEAVVSAFSSENQAVAIRCMVAAFDVEDGKMTPNPLIISTTGTKIRGSGMIDLRQKQLDLKFMPEAKDFSFFSADAPLHIQGLFGDLSVGTNIGQALLSLATPVETQGTQPTDCQALLEKEREESTSMGSKP